MARKWEKVASMGKKRSALTVLDNNETADTCKRFLMPNKGHFVIYTSDQKRLEIPVLYLENKIFLELLKISEDEFGLPRDGPIILPCDAVFIKYIASLIQRGLSRELEEALLLSINASFCSSVCFHQEASSQQLLVYG
ncbi:auxin-responsive protein SAUR64-like [Diospyros lotus]|uniref:auxin-responsive protein SAUR64-like n=1 Tax=Diospyros lotus TaxID=55363 RepID=UPI0022518198|nr:auxin-responsive protein SAUR64-like [Diospyros lotus]XP_052193880.1 auxin-responsive protein SAUR64-like [Diospyros lotus]